MTLLARLPFGGGTARSGLTWPRGRMGEDGDIDVEGGHTEEGLDY